LLAEKITLTQLCADENVYMLFLWSEAA